MKIGDVVRLKTGGPKMTVSGVDVEDEDGRTGLIGTVWFEREPPSAALASDAEGRWAGPYRDSFTPETLEMAQ